MSGIGWDGMDRVVLTVRGALDCQPDAAHVAEGLGHRPHQVEVIGGPVKIRSLIESEHDAVRCPRRGHPHAGDIRYGSDLALDLGLIEEPV